jgi:hypothetical protein
MGMETNVGHGVETKKDAQTVKCRNRSQVENIEIDCY